MKRKKKYKGNKDKQRLTVKHYVMLQLTQKINDNTYKFTSRCFFIYYLQQTVDSKSTETVIDNIPYCVDRADLRGSGARPPKIGKKI